MKEKHDNGTFKYADKYKHGGCRDRNMQAIHNPKHSMFKGWMRENRRCTFNKNK